MCVDDVFSSMFNAILKKGFGWRKEEESAAVPKKKLSRKNRETAPKVQSPDPRVGHCL